MHISRVGLAVCLGIGLISCTREDSASREDARAREAGKNAYRAAQAAKRDIQEAGREIRNASKAFREGWEQERNRDSGRRDQ